MKCSCQEFEEHYPDCTRCSRGKQITAKENRRTYILQNPSGKRTCRVRVDDCVIKSKKQRKCDYLVIVCQSEEQVETEGENKAASDLYFIELKGKDLLGAIAQLTNTIEYFQSQFTGKNKFKGKVFARAVLSKVSMPKAIETDARVIKLRKLVKEYNGNFAYGSRQYESDRI